MAASGYRWAAILAVAVIAIIHVGGVDGGNFYSDFEILWGNKDGHVKILQNGQLLTMSLDKISGGALRSKREYLFGRITMKMKLIPGNSAGTVTTLYMSSPRPEHDEIDFEFLGNVTGQPYTIHTNVFAMGKGDREMQFKPWFDPTTDFHSYTILWNPHNIIFYVDDTPIRVFENNEKAGLPFPKSKPMALKSSLWNADDWATQGGRIKTDWNQAPFVPSYCGFEENACIWKGWGSQCGTDTSWMEKKLDAAEMNKLRWVQQNYMIYNYCTDYKRFPLGIPKECYL